jgi:small ubiquitin-related modifier
MPERSDARQRAFLITESALSDLSWWAAIEKYAHTHLNHFPPGTDMVALQTETRRFFVLKVIADDKNARLLSPSLVVDLAWHALLLCPKIYAAFCERLLGARGELIDHNPNGDVEESQPHRYSDTLRLYEHVFGHSPPLHTWPAAVLPGLQFAASVSLPTTQSTSQLEIIDPRCISIRIQAPDGHEIFFRVKTTTQLKKIFDAYVQRVGKAHISMRYVFDGARMNSQLTVDDYYMEDDDIIEASADQTGC